MTNKECVDLCLEMGYPVKSHSSSLDEAYADQVRRKAIREGRTRDEQPEEPKKAAKKKAPAKKTAAKDADAGGDAAPAPAAAAVAAPAPSEPEAPEPPAEVAAEAPTPVAAPVPEPAPAPAAVAEPATQEAPPRVDPSQEAVPTPQKPAAHKVVSSKPATGRPVRPVEPTIAPPTPPASTPGSTRAAPSDPTRTAPAAAAPPAAAPAAEAPPAQTEPPRSSSGKPIPPPPGPPRSASGKPIPPPPGLGGRRAAPTRPGPGARPSGPRGGPGTGIGRPGPPGGPPGPGAPAGGFPPAGRGRPGGPQQRPPRRKGRRRRNREELQPMDVPTYTPAEAPVPEGTIVVERASSPQDLGPKLNRTAADVVRFLMQQGEMVTATQSLTDDMIELFAAEVGAEIDLVDPGQEQEVELQRVLDIPEDDEGGSEELPHRPPVITVMGHVDHGKTKLLDFIRDANVVAGEAGGITQHIGAYQVDKGGRKLTFIDTPGHAAFTAMRARGAEATDIVILVVAADDGVMPQTIEAIQHAKAAEVPIVVAINKVDRENADPNRVMQQLSEHDLVPEAWGGDTIMCEVSALQGTGVDELLDNLLIVAEVEDLRASKEGRATGVVLEAHLDVGRGPVATVLVQRGTLKVGDPMVAGPAWGRIRALIDDHGRQLKVAPPSTAVQVLGLSDVAESGDSFVVAPDERKAKSVAETRDRWKREAGRARDASVMSSGAKLEDIFAQIQAGEQASLNLIVKADVQGSLEAVTESLRKLERPEVRVGFVLRGVGGITESDIQLAATSSATIIGFNVRPSRQAREMAEAEDVEIRTYEIIYKLLEDIEAAMVGMLEPEFEESVTGEAEVREVFRVPKVGAVAGCMVNNGVITRGSKVRFLRDGTIIWKGEVSSLRRFKEDVREVAAGYECGIGLSDFQDLKPGDVIETFELKEIPRS